MKGLRVLKIRKIAADKQYANAFANMNEDGADDFWDQDYGYYYYDEEDQPTDDTLRQQPFQQ